EGRLGHLLPRHPSLRAPDGPRAVFGRELPGGRDRPDRERHAGAQPHGGERAAGRDPAPQENDASGPQPEIRRGDRGDRRDRQAGHVTTIDDSELAKKLLERGLLSADEYHEAESLRKSSGKPLQQILVESSMLSPVQLADAVAALQKRVRFCPECKGPVY